MMPTPITNEQAVNALQHVTTAKQFSRALEPLVDACKGRPMPLVIIGGVLDIERTDKGATVSTDMFMLGAVSDMSMEYIANIIMDGKVSKHIMRIVRKRLWLTLLFFFVAGSLFGAGLLRLSSLVQGV